MIVDELSVLRTKPGVDESKTIEFVGHDEPDNVRKFMNGKTVNIESSKVGIRSN
jgi:hypothetical protein